MTARAMWKASISFGGVEVPVKLYSGVVDRAVRFRLLHAKDGVPVRQQLVDAKSGKEVAMEDARRGIAVEPGVFVVLNEAEMASAVPEPSRTIEVVRFVPPQAIDYAWYSRPYLLGPDEDIESYGSLAAALGASELCGIARWTMRSSRYFGALQARDGYLALTTLRSADEVVAASHMSLDATAAVKPAEQKLARQLVAELEGEFDPSTLRDEYREKVLAFVQAKAAGKTFKILPEKLPSQREDLSAALRQSLRSAKGRSRAA